MRIKSESGGVAETAPSMAVGPGLRRAEAAVSEIRRRNWRRWGVVVRIGGNAMPGGDLRRRCGGRTKRRDSGELTGDREDRERVERFMHVDRWMDLLFFLYIPHRETRVERTVSVDVGALSAGYFCPTESAKRFVVSRDVFSYSSSRRR